MSYSRPTTAATILLFTFLFSLLPSAALAQFQFFDQMFQGAQQQQHHGHHQQAQQAQNVPSDSAWYQQTYQQATCDKYLCPGTLSCVHFPHHCPCAWPAVEDKVELSDGSMLCASKGGFKDGEVARKIELARKALL